ncbi:MAG TPA: LCP family protein [Anaerolineales bacterium]|nr:LCP family protein [Anaerolineales bacterium]
MINTTTQKEPLLRRLGTGFKRLDRLTQFLLVAFIVAGLATAVVSFVYLQRFVECSPSNVFPGLRLPFCGGGGGPAGGPEDGNGGGGGNHQGSSEEVYSFTSPDPWDGSSRINVLILGLDARDWEAGSGAPRSDTMMVLTYDPVSETAGMLSIPRDLWVEIPGFGHDKINNAYALGEGNRLPGGGPGLAVETVEQFLGISINYYAQIDFIAFEQFIDIIGGVKIDVPTNIRVQLIGEEVTHLIDNGRQTLNGAYALAYARNRKEGDGDFSRAERQQQVILAIRQQLARDDVRAVVLNNTLQIYETLASGINTNLGLGEALSLGWAVKDIDLGEIKQAVLAPGACLSPSCIGPDYVIPQKSPDGLDILKPVSENIRVLRDEVFSSRDVRSPLANSSPSVDLMKMEAAQVAIYNGSGTGGLAEATQTYLVAQGMIVATTGTADLVGATLVYDYTGNPYTVQYLMELMGIQPALIFSRYDPSSTIDVEVVLGPDWAVPAQ